MQKPSVVAETGHPAVIDQPATPRPMERTQARVAAVSGAARRAGEALLVGDVLGSGDSVQLAEGARASLDVARAGRVEVEGPATLALGQDADAQLLMAGGILTLLLPTTGDGKVVVTRIATPRGTWLARPGTSAVIAVAGPVGVRVHVLTGSLIGSTAGGGQQAAKLNVGSGQVLVDDSAGAQRSAGGATAAAAQEAMRKWLRKRNGATERQWGRARDAAVLATVAAAAAVEERVARLSVDAAQHGLAVSEADRAAWQERQRQLAAAASRLHDDRRALLAAWEQLQAATFAAPDAAVRDEVHGLQARVRALLPR